jgi:hypothetical protein
MSSKAAGRPDPAQPIVPAGKKGKYNSLSGEWKRDITPYSIYFYYVTRKSGPVVPPASPYNVEVYFYTQSTKIEDTTLDAHIETLTKNARGSKKNPPPIGFAFNDVPWWRISYLVVASDAEPFPSGEAVHIERDDGDYNHSFFDGKDYELPIMDQNPISVMWTVNYMRGKSGNPIKPGKTHKFRFRFNHQLSREYPDDSGTNMGPPVPPP